MAHDGRVRAQAVIRENAGSFSLTFACGDLPVDDAVTAAHHEPNGYFWEGVATYLAPDLVSELELDSEGSMFCAYGNRSTLARLQQLLEPYLGDPSRIGPLIEDATASGFEFDD
jgi:hypothetical protein